MPGADTSNVPARARDESGFGLIELLIAMVMLNIGILALIAAFSSGAFALRRASATSNGTAVADKVMEVYRGLRNCGIYLHGGTGNDVSGTPDGIPNSTSTFYSAYHGDSAAYGGIAYYSNASPSSTPLWATESTTATSYAPVPASSSSCLPTGLSIDPTKAVQLVTGPDGQSYTAFSYIWIVLATGSGATARYTKEITITVFNPRSPSQILARESSTFDPDLAP
jgi:type II secretory pathway pseudopilin PulG